MLSDAFNSYTMNPDLAGNLKHINSGMDLRTSLHRVKTSVLANIVFNPL